MTRREQTYRPARRAGLRQPFLRKPLEVFQAEAEVERERVPSKGFGVLSLTLFGIGTMIGLGIFVVTGQVAARSAGVGVVISFILAAGLCGCAALCYAELASMAPVAGGSAYVFTYVTLGELAAWLMAWDLLLEYLFGGAALAIGWSGYFVDLCRDLGLEWPAQLTQSPFAIDGRVVRATGALFNLPAVALVLCAGVIVASGAKMVARFGSLIVSLKLAVIFLVVSFGLSHVHLANWTPVIAPAEIVGGVSRYGWGGVIAGVGLIFYSYLGFDMISTVGQEARDPQRTIPAAILISLSVCTLLYILTSLTLTGLVSYRALDVPAPIYYAIDHGDRGLAWLKPVVSIGGTVGLCSGVMAALFSQSRLFYGLARDGLLPAAFGRSRHTSRAPSLSAALSTVLAAVLAAVVPISLLGEFISAGTLVALAMVSGAVIYLRLTRPRAPRPFRVPVWPVTSAIAVCGCIYFLITMSPVSWVRIVIWMALGLAVYFARPVRALPKWRRALEEARQIST